MRRFLLILMAALPVAALAACDDTTSFFGEPALSGDSTLVLYVPNPAGTNVAASALDAAVPAAVSPELPQYAGQWDFALRRSGGALRLVTLDTGSPVTKPGIALSTRAFDNVKEASRRRSEYSDSSIVLTNGATYIFRTRYRSSSCFSYGKMQVKALDAAAGTTRLQVLVNQNCDDERLEADD